ncbi:MAG: hypothetical protein IJH25_01600 [Clostridia bacterium]|nr:hypothetical protein [Clostridia bacterium]
MRYKAILAELARKRYPLSIMLMVIGVLLIPFPYLFIHYGLEFTNFWWSLLGICIGVVNGSLFIGLGSLVEDVHDISMHTVGYDLEITEVPEDELEDAEEAEAEAEETQAAPEENAPTDAPTE